MNTLTSQEKDALELLKKLNKRKKLFNNLSIMELKVFITDAKAALSHREEQLTVAQKNQISREQNIRQHMIQMNQSEKLTDDVSDNEIKKSVVCEKVYNIDGKLIVYKGIGRMPAQLKALKAAVGISGLRDYEVK